MQEFRVCYQGSFCRYSFHGRLSIYAEIVQHFNDGISITGYSTHSLRIHSKMKWVFILVRGGGPVDERQLRN